MARRVSTLALHPIFTRPQINQLQGNIDVSFRIKGSLGSGTVYFTSVRKAKGIPYELCAFILIPTLLSSQLCSAI
ncbi:hypothetical protein HMN09_00600800 [Mycena chlorophos]|uniref:Uncharacterized protein n=1 Tax=Mycena chlorophos TaxID=658473 RepID=A0A8H6T204_MYCCL|nr:hypothetical protein HMN09_00600800 [Mycena chlorophos]